MVRAFCIQRVKVDVYVEVPEETVETHIGYLPWVLGDSLAHQVDRHVTENTLGYYPALDYFRSQATTVDLALLNLIDTVAQFCQEYATHELHRRLSRAFSSVRCIHIQSLCYTLPHVRAHCAGVPAKLAHHYAPNRIKLTLALASLQKSELDDFTRAAMRRISSLAREPFSKFEIASAHMIDSAHIY